MNVPVIAVADVSNILRGFLPLLVAFFAISVGRFFLIGIRVKRRAELLGVLESEAPEFWQALGAPSVTLWQQLFRRRDPLANDRLWFYALWRADVFPDRPRVRAALVSYRRVEMIGLGYTALVIIVAVLVSIFVRR
jgi:hypothetical protein